MLLDVRPDHMRVVLSVLRTFVPNAEVFAFGSRAKWNAKDSSDLDLCVRAGHPLGFGLMGDLLDAFSESSLPYKVDVVDWETISPSFRKIIEKDKVLIYSNDDEQASGLMATEYGQLSTSLSRSKLEDLCEKGGVQTGPFGSQLHKDDYVDDGIPIITVEHLGENRLVHENLPRVSTDDYQRLSKYRLKQGDIVFSRVGSVDRRAIVQQQEDGWLFSGRCLRVRPNPEKIDSTWLSYFFGLPSFKEYIRSIAVGATMPSLNTKILSDVPIYFPILAEQQEIGRILSALDDKVALLRETNKTLEALAQALFKSWFVDFDPVRAKSEGREPEGIPPEIAGIFPSDFEESELGEIPKGWKATRLDKACEINPTRRIAKGKQAPYLEMAALPTKGHRPETPTIREFSSGTKFINGDTLLARITPCLENGKTAYVDILQDGEVAWGSTEYIVLRPKGELPCYWAYLLSRHEHFRQFAIQAMVGTSGRQRVEVSRLAQYMVVIPDDDIGRLFSAMIEPIQQRIAANDDSAKTLAAVRDTLLPKLMSGRQQIEVEVS